MPISIAPDGKQTLVLKKPQLKPVPKPKDDIPQAPEVEKAALCAILYAPEKGFSILERNARDGFFFTEARQWLVNMRAFYREHGHLDQVVFLQFIMDNPSIFERIGGAQYYILIQAQIHPVEVLPYYLDQLREKYIQRSLFAQGTKLIKGGDPAEMLAEIDRTIQDLKRTAGGPNGSERFAFAELMAFDSAHDPNCLVGNRYLVRGGACLWAGGSGYGKSSLELQLAVYWACGVACFGLRPVRPLKSLIIQAENDRGDMSEQLQGVISGIDAAGDLDIQASRELIEKNLGIHRAIGKSGIEFLGLLDSLIEIDRPDFVWIDPLFAFAGCDLMNAAATGHFIRDGLFPIAAKRLIALNVIHHVGKPVRDPNAKKADASMAEIDFQYLGFGTSEVQNAFRAVNILVPVGNTGSFRLVLSKRGERAGAKDCEGQYARSIYLEHSKTGICWLQCEEPVKQSANLKYTVEDIEEEMGVTRAWSAVGLQKHMKDECGMSRRAFYRLWKELKTSGKIKLNAEENWVKQ